MRTVIGAAEPSPRRPAGGYAFTRATTASAVDAVFAYAASIGVTVTAWQAVVLRETYGEREPYRTVAYVGTPVPEIE